MPRGAFPIIEQERFQRHPKYLKQKDRKRILHSAGSEDWVTWTAFGLLERYRPSSWWSDLAQLARAENPRLTLPLGWEETPQVLLWHCVPSPKAYEAASRARMRGSDNVVWVERSHIAKPVEGESEIDVTLRNSALVVFVEAKLGSDVSLGTKYDPDRNQILRNIDCVLDRAEGRMPLFWMLVRDAAPARYYTQLIRRYRTRPGALVAELPHHDPERVTTLAGNLAMLLWKDVVSQVGKALADDDEQIALIKDELLRRCG